jgi:hypothetical protein
VLGDLQFFIRGELRFRTDEQGRPCGTADVHANEDHCWIRCDTCRAEFGVQGFKETGEVLLTEIDSLGEVDRVELEPKAPPPGGPRLD